MNKHTPGPWFTKGKFDSGFFGSTTEVRSEDRTVVAFVISGNDHNASLIAAAPELLAALNEVVRISDRKHDAWDAARAAIAKAEGRKL